MNADRLLALYEQVADAPDAVPRLRRFVLDLAVRGKLVSQDASDEPASELLKRIAAEKARLVKAKAIRKPKTLAPISASEHLTHQPQTWGTQRLGNLSTVITKGSTPTSYGHEFTADGINFLKVESIVGGRVDATSITSFIEQRTHEFLGRSQLEAGDILFSIAGSIGTCALVTPQILPANTNQALAIIRGTSLVYEPDFLILLLRSFVSDAVKDKARGGAMNNVSLTDLQNLVVPLPPLAEQRRIVAKVKELMALLDRLEAARTAREATRDRLTAASLARLTAPDAEPADFPANARFALASLPALTTRPDQIKPLRQAILNLAVRGKLVDQDPTDEPADVTLASISRHKQTLIKAKKLKKSKAISNPISLREEVELPAGWAWASCDEIFFITKLAGFEYTKYFDLKDQGEVPVIRAQNVRPWLVESRNLKFIPEKVSSELERSAITKPSLLVTFIGAGIGDVAYFEPDRRWHLAPNVAKAELFEGCENKLSMRYLVLFFNSPFGRAEVFKHVKVAAQPSLSMGTIRDIDVIIPPLAEQHRIVAKVDALMALCDRLEAALTTTDTTRARLLDALLHEALDPPPAMLEAAE